MGKILGMTVKGSPIRCHCFDLDDENIALIARYQAQYGMLNPSHALRGMLNNGGARAEWFPEDERTTPDDETEDKK